MRDRLPESYQQDYFERIRRRTFTIQALAPLALVLAAIADARLAGAPLWSGGTRATALGLGIAAQAALMFALTRARDITVHGWIAITMLCVTELALAFIATPSPGAWPWLMPILFAIPLAAAPFWVHPARAVICCVLCYACAATLPLRAGAAGTLLWVLAAQALLFSVASLAVFRLVDRNRRGAYAVQRHLDHEARHDALTGLPTRRRFLRLGESAVNTATETDEPLCLAFVDLDHFKDINDRHGHPAGDAALQLVAEALSGRLLADMVAARMGGEEFVLLMPGIALDGATAMVDALRREVSGIDAGGFQVTFSAGVAQLAPGESLAGLMLRADQAMLEAKQRGRDQVLATASLAAAAFD